jgi:hypothetical protein
MKIMLQSKLYKGIITSQCPSSGYMVKSVGMAVHTLLPHDIQLCGFCENYALVKMLSRDTMLIEELCGGA